VEGVEPKDRDPVDVKEIVGVIDGVPEKDAPRDIDGVVDGVIERVLVAELEAVCEGVGDGAATRVKPVDDKV
jgi:hypothetical protein